MNAHQRLQQAAMEYCMFDVAASEIRALIKPCEWRSGKEEPPCRLAGLTGPEAYCLACQEREQQIADITKWRKMRAKAKRRMLTAFKAVSR